MTAGELVPPVDRAEPWLVGPLASHPAAGPFAREVHRVHRRYAEEVVGRHGLCPFLRDVETGFGRFCVVLDRKLDRELATQVLAAADAQVVHLVYPVLDPGPSAPFERFASDFAQHLASKDRDAPVHATFHPKMGGMAERSHRVVGLLRRAPDPFVQFIPPGISSGGTIVVDHDQLMAKIEKGEAWPSLPERVPSIEQRLAEVDLDALFALIEEIRDDRDRAYQPHQKALGLGDEGNPSSPG